MPISKNGNGVITYTQRSEKYDSGIPGGTGVHPDDSFAVADKDDQLKQLQFDPTPQGTNSTVVLTSGATADNSTVVITLPAVSGTLSLAGGSGGDSFTTIQTDAGTSPVATSATDTLTLTSSDGSNTITGNSTTDTVTINTRYNNPGAGADSEQFGVGASAPYADNTVFGNGAIVNAGVSSTSIGCTAVGSNAQCTDQYGTAIGFNASATREGSAFGRNAVAGNNTSAHVGLIAFGHGAFATSERACAVGKDSRATADSSHAFGMFAESNHQSSIALGYSADSTANNQLVIGGQASREVRDVYIGGGVVEASPVSVLTIQPTGGSGTNIAAGILSLRGAASTGNATPGKVRISTTAAGSSGTTVQTQTTRVEVDGSGRVTKQLGSGASFVTVGGTCVVDSTSVGNVGTGEDDLISYSLPANSLAANNDYIDIEAFGVFAANSNNKTLKLHFGGTTAFTTGPVAANDGSWCIKAKVIRTGATAQKCISSIVTGNALIAASSTYSTPAETLSGAVTIKCTGEATSSDDIIQHGLIVNYGQV